MGKCKGVSGSGLSKTAPQSIYQEILQHLPDNVIGRLNHFVVDKNTSGKLTINLTINLGNCWGKELLAKEVARQTLQNLFCSRLPLSNVLLKIFSNDTHLILISLGENPARDIPWNQFEGGIDFIHYLKTKNSVSSDRMSDYDHVIVIEHHLMSNPAPILRVNR
jgi:hypothetical protein